MGGANGRNPVGIIVPCHRVIGADGELTGYAGGAQLWRWEPGAEKDPVRPLGAPLAHVAGIFGVALSGDGRLALTSGTDGEVRLSFQLQNPIRLDDASHDDGAPTHAVLLSLRLTSFYPSRGSGVSASEPGSGCCRGAAAGRR